MKIKVNKQNVGLRIKQIRQNKGYTLEEYGELFGASKSNVYRWEQGKVLPNKERIKAIAKFADITVNELLYGSVREFVKTNFNNLWRSSELEKNHILKSSNMTLENYIDFITFGIEYTANSKKNSININNIDTLIELADFMINEGNMPGVSEYSLSLLEISNRIEELEKIISTGVDVTTFEEIREEIDILEGILIDTHQQLEELKEKLANQ